jgi:hypothetical protein
MLPRLRHGWSSSVPLVAVLALTLSLGLAAAVPASGSGYNLTFTQSAGTVPNPNVDLVALSSNDPGGSNITVSFTVSGTIELNGIQNPGYTYVVFFGGSSQANSTAFITFHNNSTAGDVLYSSSGGYGSFFIAFVLSSGGSTLTFSVAKAVVGPASTFSLNAEAVYSTSGTYVLGFLGSAFGGPGGGGGGGTCTSTGVCTPTSGTGTSSPVNYLLYGVIIAVIVAVVVVVAVVLLRRRSTPPPGPSGPGAWYPGAPTPPPPPPQGLPPPPPPPPPTG